MKATITFWQQIGSYEYEYNEKGEYTGWCRCVGGKMADGHWPAYNNITGKTR